MNMSKAIFTALLAVSGVCASPIYFTFEGRVVSSGAASIPVGDAYLYTILVDKDLAGADVHHGSLFASPERYYAECVTDLPNAYGLPFSDKPFLYDYYPAPSGDGIAYAYLWASNRYYYDHPASADRTVAVRIQAPALLEDWFIGENDFKGRLDYAGGVEMDFALIGISADHPSVPEPGPAILLALGISMLGIVSKAGGLKKARARG